MSRHNTKHSLSGGTWAGLANLENVENVAGSSRRSDEIRGDGNDNVINGFGGNDLLIGRGGSDTFVFENRIGNATIQGFEADDAERIDLSGVEAILNFSDLQTNHLFDTAGGLAIRYLVSGFSSEILIAGYTMADFGSGELISQNDFIF